MAIKKKSVTEEKQLQQDVSLTAKTVELTADQLHVNATKVTVQGGTVMKDKLVPFLVVAIVITAFVVGNLYGKVTVYEKGVVQGTNQQAGTNQPAQAQAPADAPAPTVLTDEQWEQLSDVSTAAAVSGDENAEVVLVEFTDYQCPFCARYFTDTYGALMEKYVDTNQIAYITRDLPLSFHQNADDASLAARCAGDQDSYLPMHDVLFEKQTEWSNGDPREAFVGYANDLGLNVASFESCYDGGTYTEEIQADMALASSVGANGTPTFFINGEKLVGAQPTATFEAMIDAALNE